MYHPCIHYLPVLLKEVPIVYVTFHYILHYVLHCIFHCMLHYKLQELKEFFNARSLVDRLASVREFNLNEELNRSITRFLTDKPRVQSHGASTEVFISVLHSTVVIRECLSGLRDSDHSSLSDAKMQEIWLADIAVEQYAFILVSQLLSKIVDDNVGWGQLPLSDNRWTFGLIALLFTVRHVRFSAFHEDECRSIEHLYELLQTCWRDSDGWKTKGFTTIGCSLRESKLLLRSVLDRTVRLTESYTETVTEIFPSIVREVGRAAGVATHAVEVFADADVRANIVFQVNERMGKEWGLMKSEC